MTAINFLKPDISNAFIARDQIQHCIRSIVNNNQFLCLVILTLSLVGLFPTLFTSPFEFPNNNRNQRYKGNQQNPDD
jgi:hypothetical protein